MVSRFRSFVKTAENAKRACGSGICLWLLVPLILSAVTIQAKAAPFVYVVTLNQQFGVIDLSDGQFTEIGNGTPDGLSNLVWMQDGTLLSLIVSGNNAGSLAHILPNSGEEIVTKPITFRGQPLGPNAFDLAEVNGQLYVTDFNNTLYLVNPITGIATTAGEDGGTTGLRPDPNVPFTNNADGSLNLCDEGLYALGGQLYATFDSFALDLTQSPPVRAHSYLSPYIWRIDPSTGAATFVAQTDWQISAIVAVNGEFYAFKGVLDGVENGFPVAHAELDRLDLTTGKTSKVAEIDPSLGIILGATPVRNHF